MISVGAKIHRVPEILELVIREDLQEAGHLQTVLIGRYYGEDPLTLI